MLNWLRETKSWSMFSHHAVSYCVLGAGLHDRNVPLSMGFSSRVSQGLADPTLLHVKESAKYMYQCIWVEVTKMVFNVTPPSFLLLGAWFPSNIQGLPRIYAQT